MRVRRTIAFTVAGLAIFAGAAGASTIRWVSVDLGTHRFGQLRAPNAIVARAGPSEVGFKQPGRCGCDDGPRGPMLFDVARNGSVWVLDVLNHRLLVWRAENPAGPARTVELKGLDVRDFAIGRSGTIYLYAVYAEPPAGDSGANLWALSSSGKVRWRAHALMGTALRIGADGALYSLGVKTGASWTPLTTAGGRPLSLGRQRRGTVPDQPLGGGMHLISSQVGAHEVHFALVDGAHKIVRAWRVRSTTQLALARRALTPALIGRELVVQLDVSRQAKRSFRWEHQVVRLTASGARGQFSLDAKAVYGDDGAEPIAALRVGPDGRLYQLRTSPATGLSVARYTLR